MTTGFDEKLLNDPYEMSWIDYIVWFTIILLMVVITYYIKNLNRCMIQQMEQVGEINQFKVVEGMTNTADNYTLSAYNLLDGMTSNDLGNSNKSLSHAKAGIIANYPVLMFEDGLSTGIFDLTKIQNYNKDVTISMLVNLKVNNIDNWADEEATADFIRLYTIEDKSDITDNNNNNQRIISLKRGKNGDKFSSTLNYRGVVAADGELSGSRTAQRGATLFDSDLPTPIGSKVQLGGSSITQADILKGLPNLKTSLTNSTDWMMIKITFDSDSSKLNLNITNSSNDNIVNMEDTSVNRLTGFKLSSYSEGAATSSKNLIMSVTGLQVWNKKFM
jgi:hypothetical protein